MAGSLGPSLSWPCSRTTHKHSLKFDYQPSRGCCLFQERTMEQCIIGDTLPHCEEVMEWGSSAETVWRVGPVFVCVYSWRYNEWLRTDRGWVLCSCKVRKEWKEEKMEGSAMEDWARQRDESLSDKQCQNGPWCDQRHMGNNSWYYFAPWWATT